MTTDTFVVVQLSGNGLHATRHATYEDALAEVNSNEEKAYLIRIENVCVESGFKLTLEDHT